MSSVASVDNFRKPRSPEREAQIAELIARAEAELERRKQAGTYRPSDEPVTTITKMVREASVPANFYELASKYDRIARSDTWIDGVVRIESIRKYSIFSIETVSASLGICAAFGTLFLILVVWSVMDSPLEVLQRVLGYPSLRPPQ